MEVYSQTTDVVNDNSQRTINQLFDSREVSVCESNNSPLIENTLKTYFSFAEFRPLEKEVIEAIVSKAALSTGGGKSLTYMLPAVLASKPMLVISPIKSLIFDQVRRCRELDIAACHFTGEMPVKIKDSQTQNATINHKTEAELIQMFGNISVYRHSVFRANLHLEVKEKGKAI
jgi:superfamily II DNA helicase RecQ